MTDKTACKGGTSQMSDPSGTQAMVSPSGNSRAAARPWLAGNPCKNTNINFIKENAFKGFLKNKVLEDRVTPSYRIRAVM